MAGGETQGAKNSVTDTSISELIAAPLKAAADAQLDLAMSTVEFIRTVGMESDAGGREKLRNLSFLLKSAGEDGTERELSLSAPLLAVVPIPNLAVEEVSIDFQMEVTSTTREASEEKGDGSCSLSVCGKVSSQASNTRQSNQSAKYQIEVKARRQDTPEGLSRLLDIMAQSVHGS